MSVKMVTGDQQLIGVETAKQLGMGTSIYKIDKLLQVRTRARVGPQRCTGTRSRVVPQLPLAGVPRGSAFARSLPPGLQAKAGTGLVDGAASYEELVEEADGFAEVGAAGGRGIGWPAGDQGGW